MPAAVVSTIYIKNLNERIPRQKLHQELLSLCEKQGIVVSLTISRGLRKRGQAFVAFSTAEQAHNAIRNLNQREVFRKKMEVSVAKANSGTPLSPEAKAALCVQRESSSPIHTIGDASQISTKLAPQSIERNLNKAPASKSFGDPHNLLLLQQIPESVTVDSLKKTCAEFNGFKEARMFAVRHVGFIEFDSVESAAAAIDKISEIDIGTVTYAKK